MEIRELNIPSTQLQNNPKMEKSVQKLQDLLGLLRKRSLKDSLIQSINQEVELIEKVAHDNSSLPKQIRKSQYNILKRLEKATKIVPKNYYKKLWMVVGMAAFGIPIGVAIGASLKNMALMACFLPLGMVIGMALGVSMDQKAAKEGRQLDIEM